MTDDSAHLDDLRDETDLDHCPRCGSELRGEFPVKCPDHGPVNIDYWTSGWEEDPDQEATSGMTTEWAEFEDAIGEFKEIAGGIFVPTSGEREREQREQSSGGGVRDRINRLLGRGR